MRTQAIQQLKKGAFVMPAFSYLYVAGDTPILGHKEGRYVDHLLRIEKSSNTVRVVNMTGFAYPSFLVCKTLLKVGLLEAVVLDRAEGMGGRSPKGYTITEAGEAMLEQHAAFMLGKQETNVHLWRELINFWRDLFPSRYMQYYASLLMVKCPPESQKEAISVLGKIGWFDEHTKERSLDLAHPIARAMIDAFVYGGAPAALGMDTANPHSIRENSGGTMFIRLSGWDAHNLTHLQDYLGTKSNTYIMQYLLAIGTAIALANRPE